LTIAHLLKLPAGLGLEDHVELLVQLVPFECARVREVGVLDESRAIFSHAVTPSPLGSEVMRGWVAAHVVTSLIICHVQLMGGAAMVSRGGSILPLDFIKNVTRKKASSPN
jgi:hypothetical protein